MAVSVTRVPNDGNGSTTTLRDVIFGLQVSDGGDGETIIKLGNYQLRDAITGEALTDFETVPFKDTPWKLDFSHEMQGVLTTTIPIPNVPSMFSDQKSQRSVQLWLSLIHI